MVIDVLCQGTTSVVPKTAMESARVLTPGGCSPSISPLNLSFSAACLLGPHPPEIEAVLRSATSDAYGIAWWNYDHCGRIDGWERVDRLSFSASHTEQDAR